MNNYTDRNSKGSITFHLYGFILFVYDCFLWMVKINEMKWMNE